MRLIDANRLEEAFAKECTAECPICSYYKSDAEVDVECHCGLIDRAPTVTEFVSSPVEVVKVGEPLANSVAITKALEKGELYKRGFDDGYKRGKEERLKNKWIPVKERLPEEDGDYIVCFLWNDGEEEVGKSWYNTIYGFVYGNVIAWMPMPAPYKDEE